MASGSFNPELKLARYLPRTTVLPGTLRLLRALSTLNDKRAHGRAEVVQIDEGVSVRVHRPAPATTPAPALLWIHGGGMVIGTSAQDDPLCRRLVADLGIVVASVEYRLAPEHPFPTPLDDCYRALRWLADQPGVDRQRVAVAGMSAGGGLAAAVALRARDAGDVHLVAQALAYPMIDDRTATRKDLDHRPVRLWSQRSNRFGWRSYLGPRSGTDVPVLAAPARCPDLSGLPPTWIGVGTNDLFHDEDVEYARRLEAAGVPCELTVAPGAYHGFDLIEPRAPVSREFLEARNAVLRRALLGEDPART